MEKIVFDTPTIVLGSGSPNRAKILTENGIPFVKKLIPIDEEHLNATIKHHGVSKAFAKRYVKMLAIEKQKPFVGNVENGAVITADTVAWLDGVILEKPLTKERCKTQHEFISGKKAHAMTAHAVYFNGKAASCVKVSVIGFEKLPPPLIEEICNEPATLQCAGYCAGGAIKNYMWWKKNHANNNRGLDVRVVRKLLKKVGFNVSSTYPYPS